MNISFIKGGITKTTSLGYTKTTKDQTTSTKMACPYPPRNLTLAALRGHCVFLHWEPPKNIHEVPVDMYFIETQNSEENQWKMILHADKRITAVKLCGLDPGDHRFRIRAYYHEHCGYSDPTNEILIDEWFNKDSEKPRIDENDFPSAEVRKNPGKVEFLQAIFIIKDCIYLKWKPPGAPAVVNGYVIEVRKKKNQKFEELLNMSFPIVNVKLCGMGLTKMEFRVRPYNEHGSGPPSKSTRWVLPTKRPRFNEAEFKFYDLRSEELLPRTMIRIDKKEKQASKKPTKQEKEPELHSEYDHPDYYSEEFEASNYIEAPGKPGDPKIEKVDGDCLLLKWHPPENANKTKVRGYVIETFDIEKQSWKEFSKTLVNSDKLCGVIGKESQLRIRAFNHLGTSMPSDTVFVGEYMSLTAAGKDETPGMPRHPNIRDVKGDCLQLNWRPPQHANKTPIKGYMIETFDTKIRSWKEYTRTSKNFAQLCGGIGKESELRIRAFNDKGLSMPSDEVFVGESPELYPEYDSYYYDGGFEDLHYNDTSLTAAGHDDKEQKSPKRTTIKFKKQTPKLYPEYDSYYYDEDTSLTAAGHVDKEKKSPKRTTIKFKKQTPELYPEYDYYYYNKGLEDSHYNGTPGRPLHPKIEDVKGECLQLKWLPPQQANKTQIKGYIIETFDTKNQSWKEYTRTSKNFAELCGVIGKESQLRIRAFNDKGISMPSDEIFVGELVPTKPGDPRIEKVQGDCVLLEWQRPRNEKNVKVEGYIVETWMNQSWNEYIRTPENVAIICDATGKESQLRVRAYNSKGKSLPSGTLSVGGYTHSEEIEIGIEKEMYIDKSADGNGTKDSEDFLMDDDVIDLQDVEVEHEVYVDKSVVNYTSDNGTPVPDALQRGGPDIEVEHEVYYDENLDDEVAEFHSDVEGNKIEGDIEVEHEVYFDDDGSSKTREEYQRGGHQRGGYQRNDTHYPPLNTVCIGSRPDDFSDDYDSEIPFNECIEKVGPEVMAKCLYALGNVPAYKRYGRLRDLFIQEGNLHKRNSTEICLKEVFDRCTYDGRFRIKLKSPKIIDVKLDINFNENFEMDDCDSNTIQQTMMEIQTCHQRDLQLSLNFNRLSHSRDIICSILADAAFCIEDHTSYTCVFADQHIFKEMMSCLLEKVKEYALMRLEQYERSGIRSLNSTRLCIKCLDYFRLYQCQKEFYDYILCIKNGSLHEYLSKKVHGCFREALSVCSNPSVNLLIQILVNAVVGYHPAYPNRK
ncbi:Twitchin like protein [Argiope bruennichi]|uniref:Twitchin like protein n=1 Tax=Argiope bruennichi TaxID=94029 RepID=A0A8T0EPB6_ARGBR|nr:Twitchin like protein [Argiope bruennichi]